MNAFRFIPPPVKRWIRRKVGAITPFERIENLRRAGFQPSLIIDAGAFQGEWTQEALKVFPGAQVLMIEPQEDKRALLSALAGHDPRITYRQALLGREATRVRFLVEGTNSRIISGAWDPPSGSRVEEREIIRLADLAQAAGFETCGLLKLDLQGHELEALAGAGALFGSCEVIQTEVSWLRIGEVPLVGEVIQRFEAAGYRLYDVFGHNYRPLDGALWQTDFVFVRTDSRLIADLNWA